SQLPLYVDKFNTVLTWANAGLIGLDAVLWGASKLTQQLAAYSGPDFPKGVPARPDAIETASGCNLDRRFPGFDNWEPQTGEATQQFTTSQVSSPDAFLAAVRGKLNIWRDLYDSRDVFEGQDRGGNVVRIPKAAIQTKNLHVVTPVINTWKLQDVA